MVQESFQEFEIAYFVASLVSRDFDHLEFEAILWTVAEFAYCWGSEIQTPCYSTSLLDYQHYGDSDEKQGPFGVRWVHSLDPRDHGRQDHGSSWDGLVETACVAYHLVRYPSSVRFVDASLVHSEGWIEILDEVPYREGGHSS